MPRRVRPDVAAWLLLAGAIGLAGCGTPAPSPDPPVTRIVVAQRGWHTDVCLRAEDADAWVNRLARGFQGARFLCLGFGERQYVVARTHDMLTMLRALLPSDGALLLTVLDAPPPAAFGARDTVALGVSRTGLAGLNAFLRRATETDAAGAPRRLADGPYPGSVFFGATATYDGFHTCNTWTADALQAAGLPVNDAVLFAGNLMFEVRRAAARQGGGRH